MHRGTAGGMHNTITLTCSFQDFSASSILEPLHLDSTKRGSHVSEFTATPKFIRGFHKQNTTHTNHFYS